MAIEYKKPITFTKDSTIYGHQSLNEAGFPANPGNGKLSQVLDLSQNQTVGFLEQSISITVDSDNSLLYHFNIDGKSVATFSVPPDKFLKSVDYDEATKMLVFTFVTASGENTVSVDMSSLVDTYTAGLGLSLANAVFSLKIKSAETRLKADEGGAFIDLSDIIQMISDEKTERQNTYSDLDSRITALNDTFASITATIDAKVASASASAESASKSATQAAGSATTASEKATSATNSANRAATSEANAKTAESNAKKWASNPEDSIVEDGKYSALHYASKAEDAKDAAEQAKADAVTAKSDAESIKNSMQSSLDSAIESAVGSVVITADATVNETIGTPSVTVTPSGPNTNRKFSFAFSGLKGEKGDVGEQGPQGPQGETGPQGPQGEKGDSPTIPTASSSVAGIMKLFTSLGQNTDGAPTNKAVQDAISAISLSMHPVGSYYLSENATSPASLFGGTWEQIKDRFLVGAGNSYGVGATGGEASHTLSVAEMPKHSHNKGSMRITGYVKSILFGYSSEETTGPFSISARAGNAWKTGSGADERTVTFDTDKGGWTGNTSSVGSGSAFNIMNPYRAVYMWRRTA